MPSQEEWCQQQLANLRIADRRLETLAEIRHHLSMQPNSSTNWLSMRDIFNCIEDSNPENILPSNGTTTTTAVPLNNNSQQTALACDILAMCMSNLSIDESSANREYLIKCLKHSNIDVRLLGLNEVERLSRADNARTLDANTINAIIECLRHASESVSAPALRLLLRNLPGASIADPGIRSYLAQSLLVSDVVRCRVYDIAVGIAARSTADMESVSFLLAPLLVDLECGDPLLLMNVLEFVATLAQSGHSFVYLQNNGVLSKVGQLTQSMLTNPLASILVPGYLKFFGAVATTQPRLVIVEQPAIITTLFELFNDMTDLRMLPIALDTLGHLCRSTEGAILLHSQHPERLRNALVALRNSINNLPTVIKQRALNSLEEMMLPDTYPINNQMTTNAQQWYGWLSDQDVNNMQLTFLHDFCRNPFPDIKFAAIRLLAAVCKHGWGQLALARSAGFIEYLLDRNVDFDKEVKQEKFALIVGLSKSDCFEESIAQQVQEYVSQGAFYVTGTMEVAVEDS